MKCHFGDKESCTDMCQHYKTCIWSANNLKVKSNIPKREVVRLEIPGITKVDFDDLIVEIALQNLKK